MGKEKDIVKEIVEAIRTADQPVYREGAWERFKSEKLASSSGSNAAWWSAAAAILLVFGGGLMWFIGSQRDLGTGARNNDIALQKSISPKLNSSVHPQDRDLSEELSGTSSSAVANALERQSQEGTLLLTTSAPTVNERMRGQQQLANTEFFDPLSVEVMPRYLSVSQPLSSRVTAPSGRMAAAQKLSEQMPVVALEQMVLAQNHWRGTTQGKEVDGESKRFKFTDRFSLGLVVSPNRTDQRSNFGGGLLFSYSIGKRLKVRTGATFNQYEVGMLTDPSHPISHEVAKAEDMPVADAGGETSFLASFSAGRMALIPNVNAVTGNVQTIDVPVEAALDVYKGFYVSGGLSYSAVLNQERFAHYVENVNANPYSKGLPATEEELRQSTQPVTRTIESAVQNVNATGFGGFVNMSVGKDIKFSKGVSFSVEPFVKIPVGSFRRADMNYTNGGFRIITNF